MGAKLQNDTNKQQVPGAGTYDPPSKVSKQ